MQLTLMKCKHFVKLQKKRNRRGPCALKLCPECLNVNYRVRQGAGVSGKDLSNIAVLRQTQFPLICFET